MLCHIKLECCLSFKSSNSISTNPIHDVDRRYIFYIFRSGILLAQNLLLEDKEKLKKGNVNIIKITYRSFINDDIFIFYKNKLSFS